LQTRHRPHYIFKTLILNNITWLKHNIGYDDALVVFSIHGIGGIVGAVLTGVSASKAIGGTAGLLEGYPAQVLTQLWGIAVTIVWCAVASFILLQIIDMVIGLRVDGEIERNGLDLSLHGEPSHDGANHPQRPDTEPLILPESSSSLTAGLTGAATWLPVFFVKIMVGQTSALSETLVLSRALT